MASFVATLPPPPLMVPSRNFTFLNTSQRYSVFPFGKRHSATAVVQASGDGSESSTSISIVKSVQNIWDQPEDRLGLVGLGFAAVVAVWAATNFVTAIDKLPLIPGALEFIGLLFSWWFVYRYLLFKPDREELLQIINKSVSDVLGQ